MSAPLALSMRGISKSFPGVKALNKVDFELAPGEVHGLVGENGAGKSTLMKVLGGAYLPDEGFLEMDGRRVDIRSPRDALAAGVSVIYQEFNLVPAMTVAENIFLGDWPRGHLGIPDRRAMVERSAAVLHEIGFGDLDPTRPIRSLSTASQQAVEIAKALVNEAKILVMDEPTAVLTKGESELLFGIMDKIRAAGKSIIFISHRLEEIRSTCDRVTVLRDGALVATLGNARRDISEDELVKLMVGRAIGDYFPIRRRSPGGVALEARGISALGLFQDISLELREGEILGMYGLVGSGRTEIAKALAGIIPLTSGEILIRGQVTTSSSLRKGSGLALIPEDRKREGLVLGMSLADNIALPNLKAIARGGTISSRLKRTLADEAVAKLGIKPAAPERKVVHFSGGNQQKVVISKWLASNPGIIVFDEPTRGIDVGAKAEIYRIISSLADEGAGIIMISSEMLEVLGMSDRIAVVKKGRLAGFLAREEADQERLVRMASGFGPNNPEARD